MLHTKYINVVFVFNMPSTAVIGDGATALSLVQQTGETGDQTCNPWLIRPYGFTVVKGRLKDFHIMDSLLKEDLKIFP